MKRSGSRTESDPPSDRALPEAHLGQLDQLADWYWWHVHRAETAVDLAARFLSGRRPLSRYADIGCGPGSTTRYVARRLVARGVLDPGAEVIGLDSDPRLAEMCRRNGVRFIPMDATRPGGLKGGPFDVFTVFDVLEHLEAPQDLLVPLRSSLGAGSIGVVTVPAFPMLFSHWDVVAGHHRRYRRRELADLLRRCGYEVLWSSYLHAYAFPPALLRRRGDKPRRGDAELEFPRVPAWLNRALRSAGWLERRWFRVAAAPVGTSVVAALRRA
jgi:SAM-dependent methyltransferase